MILFIVTVSLIINGVLSHVVAGTAREKKIGYSTTFWVSFLLSPLFGLLLSIASPVDTTPKVVEVEKPKVKKVIDISSPDYVEKPEDRGAVIMFNLFVFAIVVFLGFMINSMF